MRDEDRVRILHMIDAADAVAQFVAGRSRADLGQDRKVLRSPETLPVVELQSPVVRASMHESPDR